MNIKFKIGDKVEWASQASSYEKRKTGEIVKVVNPGINPRTLLGADEKYSDLRLMFDGWTRDHESYLVAVRSGKTIKSKMVVYWPRVKNLKKL